MGTDNQNSPTNGSKFLCFAISSKNSFLFSFLTAGFSILWISYKYKIEEKKRKEKYFFVLKNEKNQN